MLSLIIYIITFILLRIIFNKHKSQCKVLVMEMNFEKFNALAVIFLFFVLEIVCVVILFIDSVYDNNHKIELTTFALNSLALSYYVNKHKSNICYYYRQLKKFKGKH